jgi:hypothetical protein
MRYVVSLRTDVPSRPYSRDHTGLARREGPQTQPGRGFSNVTAVASSGSGPKSLPLILARELASNLATPMFLIDATGTLVFYNEAAELLIGKPFAELGADSRGYVTISEGTQPPVNRFEITGG